MASNQQIEKELAGQVAVVTGGGRGIGRAVALALAKAGTKVAAVARTEREVADTEALIRKAGGQGSGIAADVTDAARIQMVVDEVTEKWGPISIVVNNAGTVGPIGPFGISKLEDWWRTVEVNLLGTAICSRAILPGMVSRRCGRIINMVTSGAAFPYLSAYVTSKTAIMRLTETVAQEVRAQGVTIFAVGPGTTRTALSERSLHSPEGQEWIPWFGRIFDEGWTVPMDRPVKLILTLASGAADRLSGRFVSVADDVERMVESAGEIEAKNLYALQVKKLGEANSTPALASIYADALRGERLTLQTERTLAGGADEVFSLWTDPQAVTKWFVHKAEVHWIETPTMEVREGGRYSFAVARNQNEDEVFRFMGIYRQVIAGQRLVFSWNWESLPLEEVRGTGATVVRVEFASEPRMTKVTLTQSGFPSAAARIAHVRGWERCFDGMAQMLSRKSRRESGLKRRRQKRQPRKKAAGPEG